MKVWVRATHSLLFKFRIITWHQYSTMDSGRIESGKLEEAMLLSFKTNQLPPMSSALSATTQFRRDQTSRKIFLVTFSCILVYCTYKVLFHDIALLILAARPQVALSSDTASSICGESTTVPQYFQTSPELWAGPTATGQAPFLAQTNPVSF